MMLRRRRSPLGGNSLKPALKPEEENLELSGTIWQVDVVVVVVVVVFFLDKKSATLNPFCKMVPLLICVHVAF